MPEKTLHLIAGLGNPGKSYDCTRHNAGFILIDNLSDTYSINLNQKLPDVVYGIGKIEDASVILAKPQAYMNKSGPPLSGLLNHFRIQYKDMLVVHDDIDLDFGRLKIKEKGGHGGHKGLKSIIETLSGDDFIRLRIGIGRPEPEINIVDYVLAEYSQEEQSALETLINKAREAVVTVLCLGAKEGMNRFNRRIKNSS